MKLYRDIDIQAITDNLDKIIDDANSIMVKTIEPTITEHLEIMNIIKKFIREKKRVVYGGTAYHELVKMKKSKDIIYKETDIKDIEFYSPKPVEDLLELCNLLYNKGFSFVQGREATHQETFTVFVNFEPRCDITFMYSSIFYNMPTIKINNILYTHPLWILVDILRQYNDPITSFWRLKDKTFFRANILLNAFPLELAKGKIVNDETEMTLKKEIFKNIYKIESLIFLGSIVQDYYINRTNNIICHTLECISTNYDNDIKIINDIIREILQDDYYNLNIQFYTPFFQFADVHVEFIYKKKVIIIIYNNNNKCIPYHNLFIDIEKEKINTLQLGGYLRRNKNRNRNKNKNKNKLETNKHVVKIGTFILYFNHLLMLRHYYYINRSENYKKYEIIMNELLKSRNDFLNKKNITVIDKSPYQEFIIKCHGKTINPKREFKLRIEERKKKKNQSYTFTYDPIQNLKTPIHNINFNNSSGNIDNKKKI
jgi:hypothetical protein